jgi:methionine-rich copper-binding protein CopC
LTPRESAAYAVLIQSAYRKKWNKVNPNPSPLFRKGGFRRDWTATEFCKTLQNEVRMSGASNVMLQLEFKKSGDWALRRVALQPVRAIEPAAGSLQIHRELQVNLLGVKRQQSREQSVLPGQGSHITVCSIAARSAARRCSLAMFRKTLPSRKMNFIRRAARTSVIAIVAAILVLAEGSGRAVAHAIVVRTSPAQGGVGDQNIGKVDVWYDAGIRDSLAALAVISASGERVDKRDAAIDSADPAHVSVSVNRLSPGKYTVRYRALSADGHLVSGAWDFEVRE